VAVVQVPQEQITQDSAVECRGAMAQHLPSRVLPLHTVAVAVAVVIAAATAALVERVAEAPPMVQMAALERPIPAVVARAQ
jgi:hypothetical protein